MADGADDPFSRLMAVVSPDTSSTSDDPFSRLVAATLATSDNASPTEKSPGFLARVGAGISQGVRDVIANVPGAVEPGEQTAYIQATGQATPTATETTKANKESTAAFEKDYGKSGAATIGRIGGNLLASLPAMVIGGQALGAASGALSEAIPSIGPALDFLMGDTAGSGVLPILSRGVAGAGSGAVSNALTTGTSDQSLSQRALTGAEIGGPLAMIPGIAGKIASGASNIFTGGGVKPEVAQLAQTAADKFNIPVRGSQISESPFIHYLDSLLSKMPFMGIASKDDAARTAFTKAVSNTFGEDAPALTQEVMNNAKTRIGQVFNDVAYKAGVKLEDVVPALGKIEAEVPPSALPDVKFYMQKILDSAPDGMIDGKAYQALTNSKSALSKAAAKGDQYAQDILDALNDGLEKNTPKDLMEKFQTAKQQYKNLMTIKGLAANAGIEGEITPAALLGAVKKANKNFAFTGAGDLGDLAQIGQRFLKEAPGAGTGERIAALDLLKSGGATALGLGGVAGAAGIPAAATTGAGLLVGGRLASEMLGSDAYRNYLIRSGLRAQAPSVLSRIPSNPLFQRISPYAVPAATVGINRLMQAGNQP